MIEFFWRHAYDGMDIKAYEGVRGTDEKAYRKADFLQDDRIRDFLYGDGIYCYFRNIGRCLRGISGIGFFI